MTMNTIFIHDAGDGRLILATVPDLKDDPQGDYEEIVEELAEKNGMHFGDCSWGSVGEILISKDAQALVKSAGEPKSI